MSDFDTCGIKVSAQELVVSLRRNGEPGLLRTFSNTPEGREKLLCYLRRAGRVVMVCLESTGLYGLDVALELSATDGVEVITANPRTVRNFAQALMQRRGSDPIDAVVLEEFAACMPFQPWQPPTPTALALHAVARQLHQWIEMPTEEEISEPEGPFGAMLGSIHTDLASSRRAQERAIEHLTEQARSLIEDDPELAERFELLGSVPGIGETSALRLLGELAVLAPGWVPSGGRPMTDLVLAGTSW